MASLGEAVVDIGANTAPFEKQTKKGVDNSLGSASKSLSNLGGKTSAVGKKMSLGITTPIVGIGVAAVKTAGQFETSMNLLQASTGVTDKQLRALKAQAIDLGAKTVFSANEAGDAMLELGRSGFSASQITAALPEVLNLAATEGLDLANASGIVSSALSQFGLKAKDSGKVVNALAGASNASRASVASLSESFKLVGSAASAVGLSVPETTGALAALSNAGLDGSIAGTSLASVFNHLVPQTKKARDAMKGLGLDFTNADGSFKSIADISEILQNKFQNMDAESRKIKLSKIFGNDASTIAAVNALISSGGEGLKKYTKASMDQSAAQKLAEARMKGVQGAIEKMKGALETAGLVIGTALIPVVTKVAGVIGTIAGKFGALSPRVQKIILIFAGVAAAIGPVLIVVGSLISAIGAIAGVFAVMSVAVVAPIAAVVALVAIFAILMVKSQAVRKIVGDAFTSIKESVLPAFKQISAMITGTLIPAFQAMWPTIQKVGLIMLKVFSGTVVVAIKTLVSTITGAFQIITGIVKIFQGIFTGDFSKMWEGVKMIFSGAITILLGGVRAFFTSSLPGLIMAGFGVIRGLFTAGWNALISFTTSALGTVGGAIASGFGNMVGAVKTAWNAVGQAIQTGVSTAVNFVKGLPGKAASALGSLGGKLASKITGAFQALGRAERAGINNAVNFAKELPGKIGGAISNLASTLASKASSAFMSFVNAEAQGIRKIVARVREIPGKALSALGDIGTYLIKSGEALMRGFITGIGNMAGKVKGKVKSVLSGARNLLPFSPAKEGPFSGKGWTLYSGESLMKGLADGITLGGVKVKSATQNATRVLRNTLNTGLSKAMKDGTSGVRSYLRSLSSDLLKNGERSASNFVKSFSSKILKTQMALDQVTAKLAAATDVWKSKLKEMSDFRASMISSLSDTSGINGLGNFKSIVKSLAKQLADTKKFAEVLAKLKSLGLNSTMYQQIASGGTEALAGATALVNAGAAGIAQVNALQGQISSYATQAGTTASNYLYAAGVAAAKGVVDGLKKQQASLNAAMDKLGIRLASALTKAINNSKGGLTIGKNPKKPAPKRKHALGTLSTLGGSFLAGETGPELVRAPARSRVFNAQETANLAAGGGTPGTVDLSDESILLLAQAILAGSRNVATRVSAANNLDAAVRI